MRAHWTPLHAALCQETQGDHSQVTRPHLERMEIAGAAVPLHVATALDGADGDTTGYVRAALASVVLLFLAHAWSHMQQHTLTDTHTYTHACTCML